MDPGERPVGEDQTEEQHRDDDQEDRETDACPRWWRREAPAVGRIGLPLDRAVPVDKFRVIGYGRRGARSFP
jgi:hypothetical protein